MSDLKKLEMDDLEQVTGGRISEKKAYELAREHARVKKAMLKKCELDREHGRMIYEVEFIADGMEYEYDIDANSGDVLKHEKERWD